jgi:hypothetical protein
MWRLPLLFLSATAAGSSVVFNVVDYGARADGITNNTAAFSACLDALVAAGGGRMYIPAGQWRGRIIIPPVAVSNFLTVEIAGDTEPTPRFGTVGSIPFDKTNSTTIVKSLDTAGAAVISVAPAAGQYQHFSSVYVVITNVEVHTYDNPGAK